MADDKQPSVIKPSVLIDLNQRDYKESYHADLERITALFEGMRADAKEFNARRPDSTEGSAAGALRPRGGVSPIDPHRTSRTLLINGPRGSGKSTLLLLTLSELDADQEGHVHRVGLLDLEQLAQHVPLVVHVLARLGAVFTADREDRSDLQQDTDELWDPYQRTLNATARGWRTNLDRRAGKMEAGTTRGRWRPPRATTWTTNTPFVPS